MKEIEIIKPTKIHAKSTFHEMEKTHNIPETPKSRIRRAKKRQRKKKEWYQQIKKK